MAHPDASRVTRRMPFLQLRALVLALIEDAAPPEPADGLDDDPLAGLEAQPTVLHPRRATRLNTIDELIEALGNE